MPPALVAAVGPKVSDQGVFLSNRAFVLSTTASATISAGNQTLVCRDTRCSHRGARAAGKPATARCAHGGSKRNVVIDARGAGRDATEHGLGIVKNIAALRAAGV